MKQEATIDVFKTFCIFDHSVANFERIINGSRKGIIYQFSFIFEINPLLLVFNFKNTSTVVIKAKNILPTSE